MYLKTKVMCNGRIVTYSTDLTAKFKFGSITGQCTEWPFNFLPKIEFWALNSHQISILQNE